MVLSRLSDNPLPRRWYIHVILVSQMAGVEYFLTTVCTQAQTKVSTLSLKRRFSNTPTVLSRESAVTQTSGYGVLLGSSPKDPVTMCFRCQFSYTYQYTIRFTKTYYSQVLLEQQEVSYNKKTITLTE